MAKLDQLLQQIRNEIGGDFISMSVSGPDGISIARETINPDKKASDDTTTRAIMLLQLAKKVSDKLGLGQFEENMLTSDKIYGILAFLGDGSYSWTVAVSRKATLGTVRMVLADYAPQVWDAIPR
jgi:predicted regulator of Ras-like GTPase activity (Roadblock/LC7/MglB family)